MPSALNSSKQRTDLEKILKSRSLSTEHQAIVAYLKMRLERVLQQWLAGVAVGAEERLRGEAACLKDLIQVLSNSPLELVQGDN